MPGPTIEVMLCREAAAGKCKSPWSLPIIATKPLMMIASGHASCQRTSDIAIANARCGPSSRRGCARTILWPCPGF